MGEYFTSGKFYSSHRHVTSRLVTAALSWDDNVMVSRFLPHRSTTAIKVFTTMPVVSWLSLADVNHLSLITSTDSAASHSQ
jgi:hypothetical protein